MSLNASLTGASNSTQPTITETLNQAVDTNEGSIKALYNLFDRIKGTEVAQGLTFAGQPAESPRSTFCLDGAAGETLRQSERLREIINSLSAIL